MTKETEWKGEPSQLLNIGIFLSGIFIVTLPLAIVRWKILKSTSYELGKNSISSKRSFLEQKTEGLKIEEIEDVSIEKPLFLKLIGLSNVIITSSKNEKIVFAGLKRPEDFLLQLKKNKDTIKF